VKRVAKRTQPSSRHPDTSLQAQHSRAELAAMGKALRDKCPRAVHGAWKPPRHRPDPVRLIKQADQGRIPELLPLRHGRMLESIFTFFRGAALNMAVDLASMPSPGIRVQCCGDAHLVNFRGFGTPERRVQFDIHDLDETLPAPWEWDVKRLGTSFVLACRDNGLGDRCGADAARACARSYRQHMIEYGNMPVLDTWYTSLDADELVPTIRDAESRRRVRKRLAKERARNALEHDFPKLAHRLDCGRARIRDNPPTIYHPSGKLARDPAAVRESTFAEYRRSLPLAVRVLLDRFKLVDIAIKVVGVGSVGTRCWVLLLMAEDTDPLFLQMKEARASVLEAYAGKSIFPHHGQRVVHGHRLMQSASDTFLGWCTGKEGQHYYVRQLRDIKLKPTVQVFSATHMIQFGEWCGWTLARAHARSGDPALIGGYLGTKDTFDKAIAAFSILYADQTERDYELLRKAVRAGKLEVATE
jgi:uncharacterized protein (DUF2252 family)